MPAFKRLLPWLILQAVLCLAITFLALNDPYLMWRDDYVLQYLPGFVDIGKSLMKGEFPLLSGSNSFGGLYAAEYQYGIFSPCTWLVAVLLASLPFKPVFSGHRRRALLQRASFRRLRLGKKPRTLPSLSIFVGLSTALSGWIFSWGACDWIRR